jgi:hypothetical protein
MDNGQSMTSTATSRVTIAVDVGRGDIILEQARFLVVYFY